MSRPIGDEFDKSERGSKKASNPGSDPDIVMYSDRLDWESENMLKTHYSLWRGEPT